MTEQPAKLEDYGIVSGERIGTDSPADRELRWRCLYWALQCDVKQPVSLGKVVGTFAEFVFHGTTWQSMPNTPEAKDV